MNSKLFILLSLFSVITFASCKKSKLNKLTGSWELLPQTAAQQTVKSVYTFDSDNKIYLLTNDSCTDTAEYQMTSDFLKYYLVLKGVEGGGDGRYLIEKLNKSILILQCESPYMRKEFSKVEDI